MRSLRRLSIIQLADIPQRMLGPAPGAEGTPKGDPALMPLGPEPCAPAVSQHQQQQSERNDERGDRGECQSSSFT